jgi:hypothetical protein
MTRFLVVLCAAALVAGAASTASATLIDFDDGTAGLAVGGFYPGVTFSNTRWADNLGLPGGSGALGIIPITYDGWDYHWLEPHAVVATFSAATSSVSIVGLDVGWNGLTLKAYDAAVGGNLIGSSTVYGLTELGIGEFYTVGLSTPGIMRVEIFQPLDTYSDGIALDNFSYGAVVPVPSSLLLLVPGLAGVRAIRRRFSR